MRLSTLSENIRFYRKKVGWTQLQLAERLFIAPQTVSKWESGVTTPDTERLCMMADLFGISLDSLIRAPSAAARRAMIAIDGGGTKTDFVLFLENGELLRRVTLEGCNPNAGGLSHARAVLTDGIEALRSSEICVTALFAGIAGASVGNNRTALDEFLKKRYPYMNIRVEGDIHNIIGSVKDIEKCIAVICGTGSVVYGYDGTCLHRAGGWGYLFDEAGSGFDIGRDALRYCLACETGEAATGNLYRSVYKRMGGKVIDRLDSIYAKGKDYIASFAPLVFEQYAQGDEVAVRIVQKTADRLAELIGRVHRTYDCGSTVILAGGLTAQRNCLEPLLKKRLPSKLKTVFPSLPPVYGAAVQCMKLFSAEYAPEPFEQNFCNGLERSDGIAPERSNNEQYRTKKSQNHPFQP